MSSSTGSCRCCSSLLCARCVDTTVSVYARQTRVNGIAALEGGAGAVALLGPRQAGKTTLAQVLAGGRMPADYPRSTTIPFAPQREPTPRDLSRRSVGAP
jgi:ABC-type multidrug transport system ATPase subunit